MVIPHFRKGQVNGEIAVLGITKSVKKKPPASESSTMVVPMAQMTVISKGWERRGFVEIGSRHRYGAASY